jgi:hypothetical protein
LGTVGETTGFVSSPPPSGSGGSGYQDNRDGDELPEPIHDASLTDDQRAKQREARLAAAEARQKALGGGAKKKTKATNAAPLRGPNSQPLMKWSAG